MTPREIEGVSKQATAQAIRTGGTIAGTAAGSTIGMPVTGAIAGGLVSNRVVNAFGLDTPEAPVTNPVTGNPLTLPVLGDITTSDVLATAAPVVTTLGLDVAQGRVTTNGRRPGDQGRQ